jgi:hypothetical protein
MSARTTFKDWTARGVSARGGSVAILIGAIVFATNASSPAVPVAAALTSKSSAKTIVVNGFDINSGDNDLVPASGTTSGVITEGDQSIVNEQLTATKESKNGKNEGYPIIGYASGLCTFTRTSPDGQAKGSPFNDILENCVVTAVLPRGSLTIQGVITIKGGAEQPSTLAVTSGTGSYNGAWGIVDATSGKQFSTYTIVLDGR